MLKWNPICDPGKASAHHIIIGPVKMMFAVWHCCVRRKLDWSNKWAVNDEDVNNSGWLAGDWPLASKRKELL